MDNAKETRELRDSIGDEAYYGFNMLSELQTLKEEHPEQYEVVKNFIAKCKKARYKSPKPLVVVRKNSTKPLVVAIIK